MQIKVKGSTGPPIASFAADGIQFNTPVSGVTKSMVGLGQVDNTSDADKPLSNAMKQIIESVASGDTPSGKDTRLYVNTGNTLAIQDSSGSNLIAYFTPSQIRFSKPAYAGSISATALTISDTIGMILQIDGLGIRPFREIAPNNGFLYNKGEIDGTVNYLTTLITQKQDTLSPYSLLSSSSDNPPASSVKKELFVNALNPLPGSPGNAVPCIRALTLPAESLLRFQENSLISPWLGIDDSLIRTALNNRYTKGEIDFKFRQKSDSIGFSDIPILGSVFTWSMMVSSSSDRL